MNKAGQSYDAPNGLVENYGEIIGRAVHFTASGAFTEVAPCMRSIHWKNAPSRPERTAAHRPTLRWTVPHAAPKTSTSRSHRAASSYLVSRSSAPPSRARVRRACLDYSRQTESQQQGRDARPCTPQVRYVCCTRTTTSASSRTARTRPTDGSPRGSWSCRCAMNSSRDARPDDGVRWRGCWCRFYSAGNIYSYTIPQPVTVLYRYTLGRYAPPGRRMQKARKERHGSEIGLL